MNLSWVRFMRHELDASLASAERSLALNPNDPGLLCTAGLEIAWSGNWERGIALIKKAMALSPYHPRWCHFPIAGHLYLKSEYEQALAESLKINMPDFFWTQAHLAANYGQLGRKEEAKAAVARLLKLYPEFGANVRRELRKYNLTDDQIEHSVEGYRKAGLDIPPEQ